MKKIPFFDYPNIYKRFEIQFDEIFKDVCSRGAFILQKDLIEFEQELAKFLGVKHAFGVADGTNAMILGLKALQIGSGDEVIIASHTYVATAAAVHLVGAKPIFADIGDDNLISPQSVANKITSKTKAIMPTQLNGRCANMDMLQSLASQRNLLLIEDSAQGLGARFRGQCAGTFGAFGTLSFYPAKLIGCFGDGGAVLTNDDELAAEIALLRDHGRDKSGAVVAWGTNSRLDNLQAAFLKLRLRHYDEDIARRREIARKYTEGLCAVPEIKLPPPPTLDGCHFDVYQNYEIAAENRDDLKDYLNSFGVGTIIQWAGTPVHHFSELGYGKTNFKDLEATDWFFEHCLMLPIHMGLQDVEIEYIIDKIIRFYRQSV